MSQLICQNLSAGYDGKTVLKNLSFEVSAGDYLCIVGENGSGMKLDIYRSRRRFKKTSRHP